MEGAQRDDEDHRFVASEAFPGPRPPPFRLKKSERQTRADFRLAGDFQLPAGHVFPKLLFFCCPPAK